MQEFGEIFDEKSHNLSKVISDHKLFGRQTYICENLKLIDDDYRKGVIIKGRELFVYKDNIIKETDNMVSDGRLTITILTKM